MGEELSLLRAAAASPDDDLPRLIFADWLEENGQPDRAAFVRAQCRAAAGGADAWPAFMQQAELRAAGRHVWGGRHDDPAWLGRRLERGFPDPIVPPDWPSLAERLDDLVARFPVTAVHLRPREGELAQLAERPEAERLRDLMVRAATLSVGDLDGLAASPRLQNLTSLRAIIQAGAAELGDALANQRALPGLKRLALTGLDGTAAIAVAAARHWADLRRLTLAVAFVPVEVFEACQGGPRGGVLEELALHGCTLPGNMRFLDRLGGTGRLRRFTVSDCDLNDKRFAPVGRADLFADATEADLQSNSLTGAGLTHARFWPKLTALHLGNNRLDTPALDTIFAADVPPGLRRLRLQEARINPPRAAMLAEWAGLARLTALDLSGNPLGDTGAATLADSPHAGRLKRLNLSQCAFGDRAAVALAGGRLLEGVESLDVSDNGLGPAGVAALARSPAAASLRALDLTGRALDGQAARELMRSPHLGGLCRLRVTGTGLPAKTLKALAGRFGAALEAS